MRCIYCQSLRLPSLPHLKYKHQLRTPRQLWLSSFQPTNLIRSQHVSRPFPLATRPITTVSLALGFNSGLGFDSPANTGDLSVLIQTSALLFFAYWLANFVVPDIISRHLGLDKRGESEEPDGNNPFDDEKR
ncbi:hypothetical protein AAG906_011749 [Vitis piasezkii]